MKYYFAQGVTVVIICCTPIAAFPVTYFDCIKSDGSITYRAEPCLKSEKESRHFDVNLEKFHSGKEDTDGQALSNLEDLNQKGGDKKIANTATVVPLVSAYEGEKPKSSSLSTQTRDKHMMEVACSTPVPLRGNMTPVELYKAVPICIRTSDLETAATLFALAGAYGRFDAMRVADVSARQAASVLTQFSLESLTSEQRATFGQEVSAMFKDEVRRQELCEKIKQIGPPTYYPRYMVRHGMDVILGKNQGSDGLIQSFDPKDAWKQTLSGYLSCR